MDIALNQHDVTSEATCLEEWEDQSAPDSNPALQELVRQYGGMVFQVCLGVTHHRHDAEDAAQSVFLNLARRGGWSGQVRRMGPWLQRVAYRLSLDLRRSSRRRRVREERHAFVERRHEIIEDDSNDATDLAELRPALMQELDRLPARYRSPLFMYYFNGMSREQIAQKMSCNTSTLGVQLHRARRMLAARLAARHPERFAASRNPTDSCRA